jgi:hypothetical protein
LLELLVVDMLRQLSLENEPAEELVRGRESIAVFAKTEDVEE